jgi:hypothetical protein
MIQNELIDLISRFSDHPIPALINRHIYLWIGEPNGLISRSPGNFFTILDLHRLCQDLNKTPSGEEAARRELSTTIENWIAKEFSSSWQQRGLLVTGLDLLYRYRLPMSIFFRLSSESCMIVLAISAIDVYFHPTKVLPSCIQFSPYEILKHIATEIPEEAIVKEG